MAKILFIANVFSHFRSFHLPYIEELKAEGHEVHVAAGGVFEEIPEADRSISIPIQRTMFSKKNIDAIRECSHLLDKEKYDLISCHTALGGAVARMAHMMSKSRRTTKLVYMAHGFHFYKGGSYSRWLIHYPIERFLSYFTDGLITINQEDYDRIKGWESKRLHCFKVPGIGCNSRRLVKITPELRESARQRLGFSKDDFILLYLARFSEDKNQTFIVQNAVDLKKNIPNLKIILAGDGPCRGAVKEEVRALGLENTILLPGKVDDISDLLASADVGISSCKNEGFGIGIVEEQWAGLPVVASINRGHNETIKNGETGLLFDLKHPEQFIAYITKLYKNPLFRKEMAIKGSESAQMFMVENVKGKIIEIYNQFL